MANKKKKKTKRVYNKKKKSIIIDNRLSNIVSIVILLFLDLFILLSLLGYCGYIGDFVKLCILSIFGTIGYFFPLIFIIQILFKIFYKSNKYKIYILLLFFISIIGLVSTLIGQEFTSNDVINNIIRDNNISLAWFSFEKGKFGAGGIVTFFNFFFINSVGQSGTVLIWAVSLILTSLFSFGLEILHLLFILLYNVVMFIPNIIKTINKTKMEDLEIERQNEELVKKALANRKNKSQNSIENKQTPNQNLETEIDSSNSKENNNIAKKAFDDLFRNDKKKYDTSKIKLNPYDIQSHFFRVNDYNKYHNYFDENNIENQNVVENIESNQISENVTVNKKDLLNQLKENSLNEIMSRDKNLSSENFFYTDKIEKQINIDEYTKKALDNANNDIIYNNTEDIDNTNSIDDNIENINLNTNSEIESVVDKVDNKYSNDTIEYREGNDPNKAIINTENKPVIRRVNSKRTYKFPPQSYLNHSAKDANIINKNALNETANILQMTLEQFGVKAKIINVTCGPTVTRYEIQPELGVRVKKILELQDDIKLAIAATDIRIEAPIPGKSAIGIEVPNKETKPVFLGDIISTKEFKEAKSKLTVAIGKDIGGKTILCDLQSMPHLLVAGSTGSGKSVCINSIIMSIIYKATPEEVRLIMVDPKVVELQVYNDIPHLLIPVVTDPKKAASALNWAVTEMMRRYNLMVETGLKDIDSYNDMIERELENNNSSQNIKIDENGNEIPLPTKLPKIVIIVDEFADLMMVASKEVEDAINRIAQLARACGIYLVIATQRPSVNVISGSIKTNVPGRIAFAVASGVDSRTILDTYGAEKLLGKGDMLYHPSGAPKAVRVQGCFVSETEIKKVVEFIKYPNAVFDEEIEQKINSLDSGISPNNNTNDNEYDELFIKAGRLCIEANTGTSGFLQRKLQIGFNRAARILDQLAEAGVVSEQDGKKPRVVLMTIDEFVTKFGA